MSEDAGPARRAGESKTKQYAPRLAPDDRRQQLLDAALRIAVRQGFNDITMGNVAKACGVTRPVVYSQFSNRNDMVEAMIDREVSGAIADLDAAIPDADAVLDPRAAYLNGVRVFLTAVTSHPERWQIALAPPHGLPTEIRSMVEDQRSRVVTEIEHFLLIASHAEIPEPELVSIMIVGMLERIATTMITEPGRLDLDRVLRFAELMFDPLWGAASHQAGR